MPRTVIAHFLALSASLFVLLLASDYVWERALSGPKPHRTDMPFPRHILVADGSIRLVRAAADREQYSIETLELLSRSLAAEDLRPGESMVLQFFDDSYNLRGWDHRRAVSAGEERQFLCEIEVHCEQAGSAPRFRTVVRLRD